MGLFRKAKQPEPTTTQSPLDNLSFDELLERKVVLDDAIKRRGARELDGFVARFQALASSLGVSVGSIFGIRENSHSHAPEKKKRETRPKYRYGENEWSGRGKPPKWMSDLLDAGHVKDEYLIEKPNGATHDVQA